MTGRKWVVNFWVFDKSNEEVLISNTNSAWLSQYSLSFTTSTVYLVVRVAQKGERLSGAIDIAWNSHAPPVEFFSFLMEVIKLNYPGLISHT